MMLKTHERVRRRRRSDRSKQLSVTAGRRPSESLVVLNGEACLQPVRHLKFQGRYGTV